MIASEQSLLWQLYEKVVGEASWRQAVVAEVEVIEEAESGDKALETVSRCGDIDKPAASCQLPGLSETKRCSNAGRRQQPEWRTKVRCDGVLER